MKGVRGFFLLNSLSLRARDDISKSQNETDCEFEALWLEIVNNSGKNLLIGAVYNHPSKNFTLFLDYIQSVFTKIHRENKLVVLSGDFNLNLLKHDKIPNEGAFINLMLANFYKSLITLPTRIHPNSCPTLIYNIFINTLEYETVSGNLIDSISDHPLNFAFVANATVMKVKDRIVVRDYRSFNSEKYIEDFNNLDLESNINDVNTIDKKYEEFQSKVLKIIYKHAPLNFERKRQRKQQLKPWITNRILKFISSKNKVYKKYFRIKDDFWCQRYKKHRNMLSQFIRLSKRQYHLSYLKSLNMILNNMERNEQSSQRK